MFSVALVSKDGMHLRFDENMRFSGGEDTEFFERAHAHGARICNVPEARVHETIPVSKTKLSYFLATEARNKSNVTYTKTKRHGVSVALLKMTARSIKYLSKGIVGLLLLLFAWVSGDGASGRQKLVDTCSEFARAYGAIIGFTRARPQPYKTIHGE